MFGTSVEHVYFPNSIKKKEKKKRKIMCFFFLFSSFCFSLIGEKENKFVVSLEVELCGFENVSSIQTKIESYISFFMPRKHFENFDVEYNISFNVLPDDFIHKYEELLKKDMNQHSYVIYPTGNIPSLFSKHYNQRKQSNPDESTSDYFLYLMNSKNLNNIELFYGSSHESDNCFIMDMDAAFCHFSLDPEYDEMTINRVIFRAISQFMDTVLVPDLPQEDSLSLIKIQVPIVSFGIPLKPISIQKSLSDLLPNEISAYVNLAQSSLYNYPIIAAGLFSKEKSDENIMNLILKSEQVLGPSFANAFNTKIGCKFLILPIFIFEEEDPTNRRILTKNSTSAIFASYDDAEKLTLSAIATQILNVLPSFSGHYPMIPKGGADDFSPIISKSLLRSLILNDVRHSLRVVNEMQESIKEIKEMDLQWVNISYYEEQIAPVIKYINKTKVRFSMNELSKALSSSDTARTKSDALQKEINELQTKIQIFSKCCPVIKFIHRDMIKPSFIFYIFDGIIVLLAILKFIQLYRRKKLGYAPAAFDF